MGYCEILMDCPFFKGKMTGQREVVSLLKDHFCRSDFPDCARYIVYQALGLEKVPPDLLPYDIDTAEAIVRQHQA